jgi:hypothetical protein
MYLAYAESHSGALALLHSPGVDLHVVVEQLGQQVCRDALALVGDSEGHAALDAVAVAHRDLDGGVLGRELDGVAQEVGQHVLDAVPVSDDLLGHVVFDAGEQRDALGVHLALEAVAHGVQHVLDEEVVELKLELAVLDLLDAQHVVESLAHVGGRLLHHAHSLAARVVDALVLAEQVQAHGDGVERDSDLQ